LNDSVAQQKELVEASRAQVEAASALREYEKEKQIELAQPNFVIMNIGASHSSGEHKFDLYMHNAGNAVTGVKVSLNVPILHISPNEIPAWMSDREAKINIRFDGEIPPKESILYFNYTDSMGMQRKREFKLISDSNFQEPSLKAIEIQQGL